MSVKTAQNKNMYFGTYTEVADGTIAVGTPRAIRWVNDSLEGSFDVITNDTKLPGRIHERDRRGTNSSAGDVTTKFAVYEQDDLLELLLCSQWEAVPAQDPVYDAAKETFKLRPGTQQRMVYTLKEYVQNPTKYQFFRALQINSLNMQLTVKSFINMVFNLLGSNNPLLEDHTLVPLANKKPIFATEQFTTLEGFIRYKGDNDGAFNQYRACTDISVTITNNMKSLDALFELDSIEKSLGMLDISGSITEYLVDGGLYNRAKAGETGILDFAVSSGDYSYEFVLHIAFDNSTLSGDAELSESLPWKTYGEDGITIIKRQPRATIYYPGVGSDLFSPSVPGCYAV